MATRRVLDLLERISSVLRSEVRKSVAGEGLEPVHIMALWYLTQANCFSNNPLAVGEYLGLTKGNMSQRLNVLEQKGLVRKLANKEDGRRLHLELTKRGLAVLANNYPPAIWQTAGDDVTLERGLDQLLRRMVMENGGRTFGQCRTCRFHQSKANAPYCALLQLPLTPSQADQICREHQPKIVG
ncbi:MAG TPA: MarR family transcriptional regulator [Nitrospira sp.]|jgi:DNA-binding MarR family transcriptional regulator|nr:MarR family transcriptional regulator [Nitrospira sp.]